MDELWYEEHLRTIQEAETKLRDGIRDKQYVGANDDGDLDPIQNALDTIGHQVDIVRQIATWLHRS
jgi:hypothetical protein